MVTGNEAVVSHIVEIACLIADMESVAREKAMII